MKKLVLVVVDSLKAEMLGRTVEEFLDQYAEVQRFALDRADEARRLKQSV